VPEMIQRVDFYLELPPDPCPACHEAVDLARKLRRNYIVDIFDVREKEFDPDVKAWQDATGGHTPAIRIVRDDGIDWIRGRTEVLSFKEEMEEEA